MKKLIGASLIALSLFACTQPSFAGNFKRHATATAKAASRGASPQNSSSVAGLLLGDFTTDCEFFETPGAAQGSFQNVTVNQHNQQTVNLTAHGGGAAYSSLENTLSNNIIVKTPISFNLVRGNGNFLGLEVTFIPHGSTTETFIDFATPNSQLYNFFDGVVPLVSNGNGGFSTTGIPQGAQLTGLFFVEFGNPNNCNDNSSNVNHLMINNRPIGLDTTAPAAFCDDGCREAD